MILKPGDTVGILGGGQLGRMLCLAAARLGLDTHVLAPERDAPAFRVATRHTSAPYEDESALADLAARCSVITYEFENVPIGPLRGVLHKLRPSRDALAVAQDRLAEKAYLAECGLPVARNVGVDGPRALAEAMDMIGLPAILKTRRFGYDGKGQVRLEAGADPADAWATIGSAPAILEELVPFVAETSIVLARAADGTSVVYDAPANVHEGGILRRSTVPGPLDDALVDRAQAMTRSVADRLGYVGCMAVEWFVTQDPDRPLVANEMAPRVHNTGHWTEDGAITSQFENHIRAIAGWPLGSTRRTCAVEMVNLIGDDADAWLRHLETSAARLHLYGKREVRPGRKMGHVNLIGAPVDFSLERC
jgi:5-(carboxyamino)imidazole ribonucleotide synthase